MNTLQEIDRIELSRSSECDVDEFNRRVTVKKNDFTLISQNIRSIYCNLDDFILTLSSFSFNIDVIVLTECRLNCNKPLPVLPNYCSYYTECRLNQNDGVVVYVKNTIKHKIKEIHLTHASCLQLGVSTSVTNADGFINSLNLHLSSIKSLNNIFITGGININIALKPIEPPQEHKNRLNYLNMLSEHGILAGHTIPTREKSCLDHIMLNINKLKVQASIVVLHATTTDHFATFFLLSKIKPKLFVSKFKTSTNFDIALVGNLYYYLYLYNSKCLNLNVNLIQLHNYICS